MHLAVRCVWAFTFVGLAALACSSNESKGTADGGGKPEGTGGIRGLDNGSGGMNAAACGVDAGESGCRHCLAASCCDDYKACLASNTCSKALETHLECFAAPGAEMSMCFGDFSRALQGDAGMAAGLGPIPQCIIQHCSMACGGPGVV